MGGARVGGTDVEGGGGDGDGAPGGIEQSNLEWVLADGSVRGGEVPLIALQFADGAIDLETELFRFLGKDGVGEVNGPFAAGDRVKRGWERETRMVWDEG